MRLPTQWLPRGQLQPWGANQFPAGLPAGLVAGLAQEAASQMAVQAASHCLPGAQAVFPAGQAAALQVAVQAVFPAGLGAAQLGLPAQQLPCLQTGSLLQ